MLEPQRFLVKRRATPLQAPTAHDIYNPDTREKVGVTRPVPGRFAALLRPLLGKNRLPFTVEVGELPDESLVFTIRRGLDLFRARVEVRDAQNLLVGYLRREPLSSGGGFRVYDGRDWPYVEVRGDGAERNFPFHTPDGTKLGEVTRQGADSGREGVCSADHYLVTIEDELAEQPLAKMLLLATVLAIDILDEAGG